MGSSSSDFESWILAEELERVLVEDLVDEIRIVTAAAHFEGGAGDRQRIAVAPVAGAVQPNVLVAMSMARFGVALLSG